LSRGEDTVDLLDRDDVVAAELDGPKLTDPDETPDGSRRIAEQFGRLLGVDGLRVLSRCGARHMRGDFSAPIWTILCADSGSRQ
jgi:hypothetical protein